MLVGVPKEIKVHEYRVGLTPSSVREMVARGHKVLVQTDAGLGIGASDDDYRRAGAEIAASAEEVFRKAEMVVKVKVGSVPFTGTVRGVDPHAVAIRPLERFAQGWEAVLARARQAGMNAVTVVGGGAGGLELDFAMDHRFRQEAGEGAPHVRVLTDARTIVPEYPVAARGRLGRVARRRNIGLLGSSPVTEVGPDFVRVKDAIEFATDATFWVAGAAAPDFLRDSGFATDARGFLAVNDFLQSESHPEVFGAGDCATNRTSPRPKAGVFAVRAGPALAANLHDAGRAAPGPAGREQVVQSTGRKEVLKLRLSLLEGILKGVTAFAPRIFGVPDHRFV